jgi:hypothetical protein
MTRLRVSVGGVIGTVGAWSNTLEFMLTGTIPNQTVLTTVATSIRTSLLASAAFKAGFCTDTDMRTVKLLYYPTNVPPATLVAEVGGSPQGGTQTAIHAPQVCVVASLRSNVAGRSGRGRTYVPYRSTGVLANGTVTSAGQNAVAGYVTAIVTAVGTALASQSVNAAWVIWSPKLGNSVPVASVLVGSQCDTIRHRNQNRDEVYAAFTVPALQMQTEDDEQLAVINAIANGSFWDPIDFRTAGEVIPIIIGAAKTVPPGFAEETEGGDEDQVDDY